VGGRWEDEEERRFYEDVQDLKDYVPSSVLGIDNSNEVADDSNKDKEQQLIQQEKEKEEFRLLEEELHKLQNDQSPEIRASADDSVAEEEDEYVRHYKFFYYILKMHRARTPVPGSTTASPPLSPHLAPQGPSQLLTALLVRLPDATNRALIDQAAIDFAFLNSKAARKRLVKVPFIHACW
jgi:regulator of nonsense transcripts 2